MRHFRLGAISAIAERRFQQQSSAAACHDERLVKVVKGWLKQSATQAGVALRLAMKDQYLYTSTFLQGLQVIDLGQAVAEYSQVFGSDPTQFGQAVTTEGDGFAMDTIVNTIPLPLGQGTATEFGLKAADFATSGGKGQLLGSTTLPTQRVKFVTANDNLHGYHMRYFKQKHSEEYFLSVGANNTNNVTAKLPGRNYLRNGVSVTYDGGPFFLDVPPIPPGTSVTPPSQTTQAVTKDQTLTLHGLASGQTLLYPLTANRSQTVNGQASLTKIGILGSQSMPLRQFLLKVHFVGNGDPNNVNQQPTLVPQRSKQSLDWLVTALNNIWTPQANVSFTIQLPTNESQNPKQVSYHVDKVLYDTNPQDSTVEPAEQGVIDAALKSAGRGSSVLNAFSPGNIIDIYFVKQFDHARQQRHVAGEALSPIGTHGLFVSDYGGSGNVLAQIIAHEIGHTIGLNHNAEQNSGGTDCTGATLNRFIDQANGDSDFKDSSSLMWCISDAGRRHVGTPLWFQLNQANPIP